MLFDKLMLNLYNLESSNHIFEMQTKLQYYRECKHLQKCLGETKKFLIHLHKINIRHTFYTLFLLPPKPDVIQIFIFPTN